MNQLARVEPTALAAAGDWGREKLDLIKRTVCPQGIPDHEFALFVEQCKRSGLDPLIKQAFCVKRRQNIGSRESPKWIDKYEFQPAEAGMLARAEEFPDFRGITAAAVHANDTIEIDSGAGHVAHRFVPGKERGAVIGAWAKIERQDRMPLVVWLNVEDYRQKSAMWDRLTATMITKCARVAALRVAFPGAFGGLYIREEMPAEEYEHPRAEEVRRVPPRKAAQKQLPESTIDPVEEAEILEAEENLAQTWIARIEEAADAAVLLEIGKQLGGRFPKGHPDRNVLTSAYAARQAELRGVA